MLSKLVESNPRILMSIVFSYVLHGFKVSQAQCSISRVFGMRGRKIPCPLISSLILSTRDFPEDLM